MKHGFSLLLIGMLISIYGASSLYANNWRHFFSFPSAKCVVQSDDRILIGTNSGVLAVNRINGSHEYFSNTLGIDTENIICLAIGTDNVIWAGTDMGLLKINGDNWHLYNTTNSDLPSNNIDCVFVDSQGFIWLSSGGLVRFDGYSDWEQFAQISSVKCITEDVQNHIWVGTGGNGLYKYDGTTWQHYLNSNSLLPSNWVLALDCSNQGTLWISTSWGLITISNNNWESISDSPINMIETISCGNEGDVWIGYFYGIAHYSNNSWTLYNYLNSQLPQKNYSDLCVDTDNSLWVTMSGYVDENGNWLNSVGSLYSFDGTNWTAHDSGYLPDNQFECLEIDSQQKVWCGIGDSGGFCIYDEQDWVCSVTDFPDLPDEGVNCFAFDQVGNTWIGYYQGGLVKLNNQSWDHFSTQNSVLPDNDVTGLAVDNDGDVWISTNGGIVKYDGLNLINTIIPSFINGLIEFDSQNTLWIVNVSGGGLYSFDGINLTNHPGNYNCISIDTQDRIWLGSTYNGLYVLQNGVLSHFTSQDLGTSLDYINAIAFDSNGNAWIGTGDGGYFEGSIIKFDLISATAYTTSDSELRGSVQGIQVDSSNNKWIATDNGICVFNEDGVANNDLFIPSIALYELIINYPNPFNPTTSISFSIREPAADIELSIFNLKGQLVKTLFKGDLNIGDHVVTWDGTNTNGKHMASGIYLYCLRKGNEAQTKRMVLIK
jgi:ligand-binding sensor domain-containing protein